MIILTMIWYRETYAPVILKRKAARLRKATGNPDLRSIRDTGESITQLFSTALARPLKLLFCSPIVSMMALYSATTYGYLYLMFTTITSIFEEKYKFSPGVAGLAYLGFGIGCMIGLIITGMVANRIARNHVKRGCFRPESRLLPMMVGCWFMPAGLFWYGWSTQAGTHWIVPIIGTSCFAIGLMAVFSSISTYLVDSYLRYAASVTAANTALRSLVGALLPLAGPSMYDALGLGWGNSLLAFISLAMCAVPFFFWKYGAKIRTHPRFQLKL